MRLAGLTAIWIFVLDQVTKAFVLFQVFGLSWSQLRVPVDRLPRPEAVEVFAPYLVFRMAWNKGINFGLFADFDMRWFLVALAVVITAAVTWWLRKNGGSRWVYVSAGFLVGGAFGNVIDRVIYGAVADFLNMSCCGIYNPYAFNVADIAIFVGAIGLAFLSEDGKPTPRKKKA